MCTYDFIIYIEFQIDFEFVFRFLLNLFVIHLVLFLIKGGYV